MSKQKQLYWEDVQVGSEVTPLSKIPTSQILVKWAGATGDFAPLHYEDTFAAARGLGRPIVHGQLKRAWLGQMMTEWIGEQGDLRKLACQFRSIDYPRLMKDAEAPTGEVLTCKGRVTKKYVEGKEHLVDCEIWVENIKGEKTTPGSATAALPTRS